jgi:hypothetical protein
MKKTFTFILSCIIVFSINTHAQLGNLQNQIKSSVKTATTNNSGKSTSTTSSNTNSPSGSSASNTNSTSAASATPAAEGKNYYVSITRGKGKVASKEEPAKDLGNIILQLLPGDVIHVAEGTYLSRGESGSDVISVPVTIIGGYDDNFTTRDPWGAHKTIFTGNNTMEGSTQERLKIYAKDAGANVVVDGIIFDNGPRNRYKDKNNPVLILRKADPAKGENPTPESGGVYIETGVNSTITVKNCVVINTAPTEGAIEILPGQNGKVVIENNLILNNTGEGIYAKSGWHPKDGKGLPSYTIKNNTILFCWKHDAIATYGGNCLKMDNDITLSAEGNVLGFGDYGAVDNIKQCKSISLKNNLVLGNRLYDYREFNTSMKIDEIEDEANYIIAGSTGNVSNKITIPVSKEWSTLYANRKEVSRAEVDASAKVSNSDANAVRSILGLPLQAGTVAMDAEIWLHKISVDDAIKAGMQKYEGKYGCSKP